eukprot:8760860-Pyramimonas_sp.AAC.1
MGPSWTPFGPLGRLPRRNHVLSMTRVAILTAGGPLRPRWGLSWGPLGALLKPFGRPPQAPRRLREGLQDASRGTRDEPTCCQR